MKSFAATLVIATIAVASAKPSRRRNLANKNKRASAGAARPVVVVQSDETYDPFLGLSAAERKAVRKLAGHGGDHHESMSMSMSMAHVEHSSEDGRDDHTLSKDGHEHPDTSVDTTAEEGPETLDKGVVAGAEDDAEPDSAVGACGLSALAGVVGLVAYALN